MKLKSALVWTCAVALLGGVVFLHLSNRQKDAELAGLRAEIQKVQAQSAEQEQARTDEAAAHSVELDRLRKDNAELLRLRNEVHQLRDDKQQLTKQAQTAQAEVQRAQEQAARTAQLQQQQQQKLAQAENQRRLTPGQPGQPGNNLKPMTPGEMALAPGQQTQTAASMLDTCIKNLRHIDAAKQQWALENGKTAEAIPIVQDLVPYIGKGNGVFLVCPSGGTYTINAVGVVPTCSIPGHALPE